MSPGPFVRRSSLFVAVLLLLGMTWLGISGGVHQVPHSHSLGQWIQTIAQLGYGVLSPVVAVTGLRALLAGRLILGWWILNMMVAGGFAPVVWGGTSWGLGLASAGAAVLLASGIVGLVRVGLGPDQPTGVPSGPHRRLAR